MSFKTSRFIIYFQFLNYLQYMKEKMLQGLNIYQYVRLLVTILKSTQLYM